MVTIARTLAEIQDNPIVRTASNRSNPIKPVIREALKDWQVDLDRRNPAPVYTSTDDGEPIYRGTDFDLFTLMMALAERRAVITIPSYGTLRPPRLASNQRIISENRHGQVLRLISNEKANSLSILIKDFNVIETKTNGRKIRDIVGVPRSFALVNPYGNWHDEWRRLEFRATKEEREFFENHELLTFEETLRFQNFVHPNLAFAFFGSRYFTMKAIDRRIKEQDEYYRKIAKKIRSMGVKLHPRVKLPSPSYSRNGEDYEKPTYETVGESQQIKVKTIEAKLVLPFTGAYPLHSLDKDGNLHFDDGRYTFQLPVKDKKALQGILRYTEKVADELSYGIGFSIRAPIRAVELAFLRSLELGYEIRPGWDIPPWIKEYQEFVRERKSGVKWDALKLNDYAHFLYRVKEVPVDIRQELELEEKIKHYEGTEAVLV